MNLLEAKKFDLERRRLRGQAAQQASDPHSLREILVDSLAYLADLREIECDWRAGKLGNDPTFDSTLTTYYRDWELNGRQRLTQLQTLEQRGMNVSNAAAFRQALEEVQDLLEERSWAELGRRARARNMEDL